jgi:putative DNA primase/helicase
MVSLSRWPAASSVRSEPWRAKANEAAEAWHPSWSEFATWLAAPVDSDDKHEQGFSPLAQIQPGKGGRINGGPAGFLALEYDATATAAIVARAWALLQGLDAIMYTTASATAECPRFRVVVRPSRPIDTDEEYASCVDHFGALVGAPPAPESRQRTRLWYRPIRRCSVLVATGGTWDVDASVAACPAPPAIERPPVDVAAFADDVRWEQARTVLARRKPEGAYTAALIARDHGLDEAAAQLLVREYAVGEAWSFDEAELADRVVHAYEYAREPPGNALVTTVVQQPDLASAIAAAGPLDVPPVAAGFYVQNDSGNADRLLDLFGADMKYVRGIGWHRWDGQRWSEADGPYREAEACAKLLRDEGVRMGGEVGKALESWGRQSGNHGRIKACIDLASHRAAVRIDAAELDADPWLFNCANGTIDLRTGQLRPHERGDLITKASPVAFDPTATCPRFLRFLGEIVGDDLVTYMLAFLGHSLTGLPADRCFQVWFGAGANGKSTLIESLLTIMGDYARPMSIGLLLESRHKRNSAAASPDLAALRGVRFASCVETDAGQRWNESMIKQLTGGDTIVARHLHREEFTIRPTWKIAVATNHRPIVRGSDAAIWDRIHLVPFEARFLPRPRGPVDIDSGPYQDPQLREVLATEAPGILATLVAGCRVWHHQGLQPPARVAAAVAEYRAACDIVGSFLAECCETGPDTAASKAELYRAYKAWAIEAGEFVHGKQAFNRLIGERGFAEQGIGGNARWLGLRTNPNGLLSVVR